MTSRKRSPSPTPASATTGSHQEGAGETTAPATASAAAGGAESGYDSHNDGSDWTRSTPYRASSSAGGLHQRHITHQQQQQQTTAASRKSLADQYKERARKRNNTRNQHGGHGNNKNNKRNRNNNSSSSSYRLVGRWLRSCLIAGIPAYIVGAFVLVRHFSAKRATFRSFASVAQDCEQRRLERAAVDQTEAATVQAAAEAAQQRAAKRKQQSQPKSAEEEYIYPYTIFLSDQETRDVFRGDEYYGSSSSSYADLLSGGEPTEMEQLCGYLAQTAVEASGGAEDDNNAAAQLDGTAAAGAASAPAGPAARDAYVERDALGKDARVVITGILNPVGFQLALALHEQCGVQVITGLDAMFPNTVPSRLNVVERVKILYRNIPKLTRPILNTYMGADPHRLPRKTMSTLPATGELDYASFRPTHILHLQSFAPEVYQVDQQIPAEWKNTGSPYVTTTSPVVQEDGSVVVEGQSYDPHLYAIRQSLTSMEQILASIAGMDPSERPHLVYASSNLVHNQASQHHVGDQLHSRLRLMDEVLADHYYNQYGVYSVAMRLPNSIYGPWTGPTSPIHQLMQTTLGQPSTPAAAAAAAAAAEASETADGDDATTTAATNNTMADQLLMEDDRLDLVHVDDVVDTLIAATQFRLPTYQPMTFDITSGGTLALSAVQKLVQYLHQPDAPEQAHQNLEITRQRTEFYEHAARLKTRQYLAWEKPRIDLPEGLARTLAWHLDQAHPYGQKQGAIPVGGNQSDASAAAATTTSESEQQASGEEDAATTPVERLLQAGDAVLDRLELPTCASEDVLCHRGRTTMPCLSDCSTRKRCTTTLFDSMLPLVQEVTEGCDIVLYTQELGRHVTDLRLHSEYMADGDPLICNFAFVSRESPLVDSVIQKVPDSELKKLGVEATAKDQGRPDAFHRRKLNKLNGRLLFRGWILLWPKSTPEDLPDSDLSMLKITPGAFFHPDVKYALFVDQSFTVSPSIVDIQFLVDQMHREEWPSRLVKRKTRPKAKFLLPVEPARRAVILLSELKYQEASDKDRLPSDTKITVYEATRFMRFENGEESPLGKESPVIKAQREFYERLPSILNRDYLRSPNEPAYKMEFTDVWARTRWVIHDMRLEEARLFRCDWYQEHLDWSSELDQLSLAYSMGKRDLLRKMAHQEPDENVVKKISEKTEMKKLLSDTFEWHALQTEQNKKYSPYEEMKILPYEIDYVPPQAAEAQVNADGSTEADAAPVPLFARIMSDRIMSYARKAYNDKLEIERIKKELAEQKEQEEEEKEEKVEEAKKSAKKSTSKGRSSGGGESSSAADKARSAREDSGGGDADDVEKKSKGGSSKAEDDSEEKGGEDGGDDSADSKAGDDGEDSNKDADDSGEENGGGGGGGGDGDV